MAKQKIVVKMVMQSRKEINKALKIVTSIPGVESVSVVGSDKGLIEVIGEGIDVIQLTIKLRKGVGHAELVSVGPAKDKIPKKEYQLQTILSVTNNFSDANLIKEGVSGKVYQGQLWWSGKLIDIAVLRFNHGYGQADIEFETEISMVSSFEHQNIVSLGGSIDKDDEKIIIYEQTYHGILQQHLSDPTLTWYRRLNICFGVACALNHIHYDVIHCDINSSKIFLDEYWEPKLFGFELSTKYPQIWKHRLLFSRPNMTPKYDVYCFGELMLEVLCGRKPVIREDGEMEEAVEIIDPRLRERMDTESLTAFLNTAYKCKNEQIVQRPTMDQIVKELGDALELQKNHELLESSKAADEGTSSHRLKVNMLKIPLSKIKKATEDFKYSYVVGSGGYGIVYQAKLDVSDIPSLSSTEGKGEKKGPVIRKSVAIKRIFHRSGEQAKQGFLTEIDLLSSCTHRNIVSLLGYSDDANEMILVYEYVFNGSLSDYYDTFERTRKMNLTWVQRLQICLDIAHGINYLHTNMEGKPRIIHRDIKSDNILLDENLNAKIADFGLSRLQATNQVSTIQTNMVAGTPCYWDPEFRSTGKYKRETDTYSFGVVLFEILSGKLAYDPTFTNENDQGLAHVARRRFHEGTLKELIDPKMIEEDDENIFTLNRGPSQESFSVFSKVAYQCLAETQAKRPTMETVIQKLRDALELQGETIVLSRFQITDIKLATENFAETYSIGLDANGIVYKAELDDFGSNGLLATEGKNSGEPSKKRITVAVKRVSSRKAGLGRQAFLSEIEMCTSYKHPNVVSLLGFCDQGDDMILVYEHSSNGSLDDYLKSIDKMNNDTWAQRLRMCLEIARGLNHLHTKMKSQQQSITHGDIRSANILLGKNWEAKIAYFGISGSHQANQEASTHVTDNSLGTKVYWDPEYEKTGELKQESDVYSFGVVLFEIFCGRLAYDPVYVVENNKGLAANAHKCFNDGTIENMIDPKLMDETEEDIFNSNRVPNQDSLDAYLKIAYQCLGDAQANRPKMETVISKLEDALTFQEILLKSLQISLKDIESATDNFSERNCIGSGRYWKAYKGELSLPEDIANANRCITIVAKRWDRQGDHQFLTELEILFKRKHENIIRLVGYCNEMNEAIIVYEYLSNGSLDKYLEGANLTWIRRLKISIDIANGLEFLHRDAVTLKRVVHRDIKSPSILLNDDWKAKISNLELSALSNSLHQDMEHVSDNAYGAFGYLDPEYKQGFLTEKSDIYSFGVVLFEILCRRLAWVEGFEDSSKSLGPLAKRYYEEGKLDTMVFEGIKEQIGPESLSAFADVAYQCLHDKREERPTAGEVVIRLKKALDAQVSFRYFDK